jgi:hypothetical protein
MAPFYCVWCQGGGVREAVECAPTLVGVNVVRPVGRSTLTPPARRRRVAAVPGPEVFRVGAWLGNVAGAGPGCGLSEEPMSGVRSVALDDRATVAAAADRQDSRRCPAGLAYGLLVPLAGAALAASFGPGDVLTGRAPHFYNRTLTSPVRSS